MRIARCIKDTDLRAYGKGFGDYIERGVVEQGTICGRARPGGGTEDPITNNLYVWYDDTDSGCAKKVAVCMAVFSTARELPACVRVSGGGRRWTNAISAWVGGDLPAPMDTNVPGIYTAGARSRTTDVTDRVARAGGAADRAAQAIREFVGKASAKAGSGR